MASTKLRTPLDVIVFASGRVRTSWNVDKVRIQAAPTAAGFAERKFPTSLSTQHRHKYRLWFGLTEH